jgi:hypothetical protein
VRQAPIKAGEQARMAETKTARRGAPGGFHLVREAVLRLQFAAMVRFFWAGWIGPGKITLLTVWSPEPSE